MTPAVSTYAALAAPRRTGVGGRGLAGLTRYFDTMSVQRNGETSTPAVVELGSRSDAAQARPVVRLPRDDQLPDPLVDELADKLSNRLADRLAGRLAETIADVAIRNQDDRDHVARIPEGATYAT